MILLRYLLIGLIVYLIVRSFARFGNTSGPSANQSGKDNNGRQVTKKVSKEIGEYIDYEEVKKK
jgi:hypothetical protein